VDPVVHVAHSFEEARAWEIEQEIRLTPAERQAIARALRERAFGTNVPDVRDAPIAYERRSLLD